MKMLPALAAVLFLALSAPAWARSPDAGPIDVEPPPADQRTKARECSRTRFENQQKAITERGRQETARPALGIPGQQPWGAPGQPSRGVPGQRPARQPKP
jgi:hypothetical protein